MESRMLPNVPNFRSLAGTKLFRSSKPDRMKEEDLEIAKEKLGIRSIIDLRSVRDVPKPVLANQYYIPFSVSADGESGKEVTLQAIFSPGSTACSADEILLSYPTKHLLFDLISDVYIKKVVQAAPVIIKLLLYCIFFIDKIFRTHYFFKCLVLLVVNTSGLIGQYKDTIKYCGRKICTGE